LSSVCHEKRKFTQVCDGEHIRYARLLRALRRASEVPDIFPVKSVRGMQVFLRRRILRTVIQGVSGNDPQATIPESAFVAAKPLRKRRPPDDNYDRASRVKHQTASNAEPRCFGGIDGKKIEGLKRTQDRTTAATQTLSERVAQTDQRVRQAKGELYCRC